MSSPVWYRIGVRKDPHYDRAPKRKLSKGDDTVSASAQNYVYYVKSNDKKQMETKSTLTREDVERMKREVSKYLVPPVERKN